MILAHVDWTNAPIGCKYKSHIENLYLDHMLFQADRNIMILKEVWEEARRRPEQGNSFCKFDAIASFNATAGLLPRERYGANFQISFVEVKP